MIVLGLTGSIGMGKSTAAAQLESLGAKAISADAIVHQLLGKGGAAVEAVAAIFPETLEHGVIHRKKLGDIVFWDAEKLKRLEGILHPLVVAEENRFITEQREKGMDFCVLEIPLLYETGAEKRCQFVIVVSAPYFIQKRRVMKRPGMTREKWARILDKQMPDHEKRKRADFVVHTGLGRAYSFFQLKNILKRLRVRHA